MPSEYVDQLIARIMRKYPGESPSALNRFFEAVHQELAPLARRLERENAELLGLTNELNQQRQKRRERQDNSENAPWLTLAHMICTDHGVPQGHIEWRLNVLRELLAEEMK